MDKAEIGVEMGFNGSKAASGMKQVQGGMSDMEKQAKMTGESIGRLGIIAGVFAQFGNAIKEVFAYSRDLKGELNEVERAARSAAVNATSYWQDFKSFALTVGSALVGSFNLLGEKMGESASLTYGFLTGNFTQTKKNLELAEQVAEQERKRGEYMEKNASAFLAITDRINKAKAAQAQLEKDLEDPYLRNVKIKGELAVLEEKAAQAGLSVLDARKIQADIEEKRLELAKDSAKLATEEEKRDKQAAADAKKAADEKKKAADEKYKIGLEFYQLEQELLGEKKKQTDEYNKQIAAEAEATNNTQLNIIEQERKTKELAAQTEELKRQAQIEASRRGTFGMTGNASSLSNYELSDQLTRLNSLRQEQEQAVNMGDNSAYFALQATRSVINALKQEVELRKRKRDIQAKSDEYDQKMLGTTESSTRALLAQLGTSQQIGDEKGKQVNIDTSAVLAADALIRKQQAQLDEIRKAIEEKKVAQPIDTIALETETAKTEQVVTATNSVSNRVEQLAPAELKHLEGQLEVLQKQLDTQKQINAQVAARTGATVSSTGTISNTTPSYSQAGVITQSQMSNFWGVQGQSPQAFEASIASRLGDMMQMQRLLDSGAVSGMTAEAYASSIKIQAAAALRDARNLQITADTWKSDTVGGQAALAETNRILSNIMERLRAAGLTLDGNG